MLRFKIFISSCVVMLLHVKVAKLQSSSSPSARQIAMYATNNSNETFTFAQNAFGIRYPSLSYSLAVKGIPLLQDQFLIEKMQSLNRERIPERVVHAKGAGASGYFQVTHNISRFTIADFLQPGTRTKVAVRLSTGAGESGSADSNFDLKGFAVKLYTREGTQDIICINFPVFLVRDGMSFPDVVRARKRNPQTHLFDPNSLFDMVSYRPEMTMFMLFFFSDIAFPKNFRYIDGFAVNTFKMVNETGEPIYVKFHLVSNQQKKFITLQESSKLAGINPDYMLADLYDSIATKNFPSWTMKIQVMTYKQAKNLPYNPFDSTKYWKEEDYPLIDVGQLVLDKNPENYFAEVEQIAFSPGRMVPGIEASPDGLLHSRMFAYPDTQLYRLGSNYAQIPVNSCPFSVRTYQRDGMMNVGQNGGSEPNYFPNSFHGANAYFENILKRNFLFVSGDVERVDTGNDDDFLMPKYFWNGRSLGEKQRIISNLAAVLGQTEKFIQENVLNNVIYKVDKDFGDTLKAALN